MRMLTVAILSGLIRQARKHQAEVQYVAGWEYFLLISQGRKILSFLFKKKKLFRWSNEINIGRDVGR